MVHLRGRERLHSGVQAMADRDNDHLEVIDLEGAVRKGLAFMMEGGGR